MNNMAAGFIGFGLGAAIGGAIGYFVTKNKLEADVDAKVCDRVTEAVRNLKKNDPKPEEKAEEPKKQLHRKEFGLKEAYNKMIGDQGYSDHSEIASGDVRQIDDLEFGEDVDDTRSLYYNAEHHILLDEDCEPITDPSVYVGNFDLAGYFDGGDHDSVYFRNEKLDTDYEILLTMKGPDED